MAKTPYGAIAQGIGVGLETAANYKQYTAQIDQLTTTERQNQRAAKETAHRRAFEQNELALQLRRTLGSQRASFASAGVEMRGAARQIILKSMINLNRDRVEAKRNADMQELGYKLQAKSIGKQKKSLRSARTLNAVGTVFKGIGEML